jgi:hypothetical protein
MTRNTPTTVRFMLHLFARATVLWLGVHGLSSHRRAETCSIRQLTEFRPVGLLTHERT